MKLRERNPSVRYALIHIRPDLATRHAAKRTDAVVNPKRQKCQNHNGKSILQQGIVVIVSPAIATELFGTVDFLVIDTKHLPGKFLAGHGKGRGGIRISRKGQVEWRAEMRGGWPTLPP